MDVTASLTANVSAEALYEVVADLSGYPQWLDIVPRAVPAEPHPDDPGPAWSVDLRGSIGPFRRSKRLRMVRTRDESPQLAVFERREVDGRTHSDWVLRARIEPEADTGASQLTMELHYGGSLWMPMLDRLLAEEISRSRGRLLHLLGVQS